MPPKSTNSTRVPRICETCGKEFMARQRRVERGHDRFCSWDCLRAAQEQSRLTRVCPVCGTTFVTWPSKLADGRGKYCSRACSAAGQSRKETTICPECGKLFARHIADPHVYCSRSCARSARARSQVEPVADRFWAKVQKTGGCWTWTAATRHGYGCLPTPQLGESLAHRISWRLHYGTIPDGLFVCHHCDNPLCVRPDHLFLGTSGDNMRDMVQKNRGGRAKLSVDQVREIKRCLSSGLSVKELASRFGVSKTCIYDIVHGKAWSSVD